MGEPQELDQKSVEKLHSLLMSNELQLQDIGEHHQEIFGNALLALATFVVEKIYHCSPNPEEAGKLLAAAQEQGLQNWIAIVESDARKDDAGIILLDS